MRTKVVEAWQEYHKIYLPEGESDENGASLCTPMKFEQYAFYYWGIPREVSQQYIAEGFD